jgi:uncharacterized protein (DUF1015 family)
MAEIFPFRALLYDPEKVPLGNVLSPPYDMITAAEQADLYARDPRNVIRLEYSKETDPYLSADRMLHEWLQNGILSRDDQSSIYLLSQRFTDRDGKIVRRNGFMALCRLDEPEKKTILPHEKTFSKPKEDRFRLLSQTKAMFSPIFSIYSDQSKLVEKFYLSFCSEQPIVSGELAGVSHDVWRIRDEATIAQLQQVIMGSQVFIADGHHRYETALELQRARQNASARHIGSEGYNYTLMYLSNVEEEGLVVFPFHRVIRGIKEFSPRRFLEGLSTGFDIQAFDSGDQLFHAFRERGLRSFGIALAGDTKTYLATLKDAREVDDLLPHHIPKELKQLDVVLLHEYILSRVLKVDGNSATNGPTIDYVRDESDAVAHVREGKAQAAFLVRPTPVEQVQTVARAGLTMPQKSTYFYPKLPAGLIMYDLEHF